LRDIRKLHMVSWLTLNITENDMLAEEARRRIKSIRTDSGWREWQPY
jgi:hypothetical protein